MKHIKGVYEYTAVFEPDPAGGFTAYIPALPGCISEGETFEETVENIHEAADLYLGVMRKEKKSDERERPILVPVRVKG